MCAFYPSVEGRNKLAVPFILEGLELGERCFLVADDETAQALLRVLGDMAGFLHAGASPAALLDFELRFDRELAHKYPVVSLCQCDAQTFSGVAVLAALECHGDLFDYPLRHFLGN